MGHQFRKEITYKITHKLKTDENEERPIISSLGERLIARGIRTFEEWLQSDSARDKWDYCLYEVNNGENELLSIQTSLKSSKPHLNKPKSRATNGNLNGLEALGEYQEDKIKELEQQVKRLEKENAILEQEAEGHEQELIDMQEEIANEIAKLNEELETAQNDVLEKDEEIGQLQTDQKYMQERLSEALAQNESLMRGQHSQANIISDYATQSLRDQLSEYRDRNRKLEEQLTEKDKELTEMRRATFKLEMEEKINKKDNLHTLETIKLRNEIKAQKNNGGVLGALLTLGAEPNGEGGTVDGITPQGGQVISQIVASVTQLATSLLSRPQATTVQQIAPPVAPQPVVAQPAVVAQPVAGATPQFIDEPQQPQQAVQLDNTNSVSIKELHEIFQSKGFIDSNIPVETTANELAKIPLVERVPIDFIQNLLAEGSPAFDWNNEVIAYRANKTIKQTDGGNDNE